MNLHMMGRSKFAILGLGLFVALLLAACGDVPSTPGGAATTPLADASPQGRVMTADQGSDTVSIIDVATDKVIGTVKTGQQPHHVLATPDGKHFWVTLYKENFVQVFDAATLAEVGKVDLGGASDDLAFAPDGKRVYISMGNDDAVGVVDVDGMKMLNKVSVGRLPHGVKVTPNGKEVYVTNTSENTLSVLKTDGNASLDISFKVGANPFEVTFSPDGKLAYVSNFLGSSVSVVDTATRKIAGTIRVGKQPAMIAIVPGSASNLIYVANTGSAEVWVIDATTQKVLNKIPAGQGTHGVVQAGTKMYVTNANDNTVTVIDQASGVVGATIAVGTTPNGLTFMPPAGSQ